MGEEAGGGIWALLGGEVEGEHGPVAGSAEGGAFYLYGRGVERLIAAIASA